MATEEPQPWEYAEFTRDISAWGHHLEYSHQPENNARLGGKDVDIFDIMRQLGDFGWELVTVWVEGTAGGVDRAHYVFKRPL